MAALQGYGDMPVPARKAEFDFSSLLGPLFFSWVVHLLLPTFLSLLVFEKEKRCVVLQCVRACARACWCCPACRCLQHCKTCKTQLFHAQALCGLATALPSLRTNRLRMMMKMHGLEDVVYWGVTYVW